MLKFRNHPATVEFKEIHCCALKTAFGDTDHQNFISFFTLEASRKEPKHHWSILTEIFINTTRIVFIPGVIHLEFYSQIAMLERKKLIEGRKSTDCVHTVKEHVNALAGIMLFMWNSRSEN